MASSAAGSMMLVAVRPPKTSVEAGCPAVTCRAAQMLHRPASARAQGAAGGLWRAHETQGPASCSAGAKRWLHRSKAARPSCSFREQVLRCLPRGSNEAGHTGASQCRREDPDIDGPRPGKDHNYLSHQTTMSIKFAAIPGGGKQEASQSPSTSGINRPSVLRPSAPATLSP